MNVKTYVKEWCANCNHVSNGECGASGKASNIDKEMVAMCLDNELYEGTAA